MKGLMVILFACIAVLPGLFWTGLLAKTPFNLDASLRWPAIGAGILAGVAILTLKIFFFADTAQVPSKEIFTATLFVSFLEAGLLEETFKDLAFLGLLLLLGLFRKPSQKFSAYELLWLAAYTGLGFALLENLHYALNFDWERYKGEASFFSEAAFSHGFMLLNRVFTALPLHMITCALFGYFYGQRQNWILGLLAGVSFHAVYDFFALPSTLLGNELVKLMVVLGFALFFLLARSAWGKTIESSAV